MEWFEACLFRYVNFRNKLLSSLKDLMKQQLKECFFRLIIGSLILENNGRSSYQPRLTYLRYALEYLCECGLY